MIKFGWFCLAAWFVYIISIVALQLGVPQAAYTPDCGTLFVAVWVTAVPATLGYFIGRISRD